MRGVERESFRADFDTWGRRSSHTSKVETQRHRFARYLATDAAGVSGGVLGTTSSPSDEQAYHKLALRLSEGHPRTFLAFGDGTFSSTSHGRAPGLVKILFAKLSASPLLQVRKVREYWTSKICSKCQASSREKKKAWALKQCGNVYKIWGTVL